MIKNVEKLIEKVNTEIKNFTDIAIIGMSGGADSTLVAILCKIALGEKNVYGIHMPYGEIDENFFNARSRKIATYLQIQSLDINISKISNNIDIFIYNQFKTIPSKINSGNSRARSRMCMLYSVAHHLGDSLNKRVRVMNTCNLSETFSNYETKYGDGAGDIAPIGNLFKSEIYQLLDYFRDQGIITDDMIDRVPSAALFEGQTDQGELGYSYDEMEPYMRMILSIHNKGLKMDEGDSEIEFSPIFEFVFEKYKQSEHKRKVSPSAINLREFCD